MRSSRRIDWRRSVAHADNRFLVQTPKTEHHTGRETKLVPIFPELRPHLEAAFDAADEGAEFVLPTLRKHSNPGTDLRRIISRAGVEQWPNLFVNLRSSRRTDLADEFPGHVLNAWFGHGSEVAEEHYLQVTDEHFDRATQRAAKSGADALQNPVHPTAASSRHVSPSSAESESADDVRRVLAKRGESRRTGKVTPRGFEPRFLD